MGLIFCYILTNHSYQLFLSISLSLSFFCPLTFLFRSFIPSLFSLFYHPVIFSRKKIRSQRWWWWLVTMRRISISMYSKDGNTIKCHASEWIKWIEGKVVSKELVEVEWMRGENKKNHNWSALVKNSSLIFIIIFFVFCSHSQLFKLSCPVFHNKNPETQPPPTQ